MAAVIDRPAADEAASDAPEAFREDPDAEAAPTATAAPEAEAGPIPVPLRPLLVAGASTTAAAFMTGGMFDGPLARVFAALCGLGGVAWAWFALRSPRRALLAHAFPLVLVVASVLSVAVAAPGGPADLPDLLGDAVRSATALKPPLPFDAGWRPIFIVLLGFLGFAAAWYAALQDRPQLGFAIPIPVLGLTAINQPSDGQLVSGLLGLLPLIAGLAVVFGGGSSARGAELDRAFEAKRALRSLVAVIPALLGVFVLNQTSFLFPAPAYDPSDKPQKPRPLSSSEVRDVVLFEIVGDLDGPWKMGVFDIYDGKSWLITPPKAKDLQKLGSTATFDSPRPGEIDVQLTVRDLGSNAVAPGVVGAATFSSASDTPLQYDRRSGALRVATGRVPAGITYSVSLPRYPQPNVLRTAPPYGGQLDPAYSKVPDPPAAVRDLLATAPGNAWDRFSTLQRKLEEVGVAVGEGQPKEFTVDRVQEILAGNHEASPYEFVASRALFARWAGIPSRIGFGFDQTNDESGVRTVRPKNASQWVEVWFEGIGWFPVTNPPAKAKATLDNEDAKEDPAIEAGADVAVEVYIPVRRDSLKQLYEKLRLLLVQVSPVLLLALGAYLGTPAVRRAWRRTRRRRWADALGPTEQVAIAYAELRDLTTDLGVGDPFATPLEYLDHLVEDEEHEELAWLVSRCLYGDLAGQATPEEATAAHELSASLQRRLRRGQPFQSRLIGSLSRSSLLEPYTDEVPNVRSLPRLEVRRRVGAVLARRPRPILALRRRAREAWIERRRQRVRTMSRRA